MKPEQTLPDDILALLAKADGVTVADDAMRLGVWSAIEAKLVPTIATASIGGTAGASLVVLKAPVLAVLVAAAVAGGALVGGAAVSVLNRSPAASEAAPQVAPARPFEAPVLPPPAIAAPAIVGAAVPSERPAARASEQSAPVERQAGRVPPNDYEIERFLIERARSALGAGDMSSARSALAEHERRFATTGALIEDRQALRVMVLTRAGDVGADAARTEFLREHPASLYRSLLEGAAVFEKP